MSQGIALQPARRPTRVARSEPHVRMRKQEKKHMRMRKHGERERERERESFIRSRSITGKKPTWARANTHVRMRKHEKNKRKHRRGKNTEICTTSASLTRRTREFARGQPPLPPLFWGFVYMCRGGRASSRVVSPFFCLPYCVSTCLTLVIVF